MDSMRTWGRRDFIRLVAAGVALSVSSAFGRARPSKSAPLMLDRVTAEDFRDYVGSRFGGGETGELELVEVSSLASHEGTRRPPFALVFRASGGQGLEQGTWQLSHEALGPLAIFLVPIGADAAGHRFEAVFN